MNFYTLTAMHKHFDDHVSIWQVNLHNYDLPPIYILQKQLTPPELDQFIKYKIPADKARFAAVRIALRELLSELMAIPAFEIPIAYNQHKKPYITNNAKLKFNVTHSGHLGLIAISDGPEVGIDVEQIRPLAFTELSNFVLSPEEQQLFYCLNLEDRKKFFYTCWVKKESVLKALGFGFSKYNPNQISIASKQEITIDNKNIQVAELSLNTNYIGAISMIDFI